MDFVWDVVRAWIDQHSAVKRIEPDSYQEKLLSRPANPNINFNRAKGARKKEDARFLPNPPNWGPLRRHGKREQLFEGHVGTQVQWGGKKARVNGAGAVLHGGEVVE